MEELHSVTTKPLVHKPRDSSGMVVFFGDGGINQN